ncbi:MAG: sprT domain-containing protein, partial [Flavobacterium sp.]
KHTFTKMMLPFLRPEIFPNELLPYLARHFKNPTASSDTDPHLANAMKKFDIGREAVTLIHELPNGSLFKIRGGRVFQKIGLKVKRYACVEVNSGRTFLFNANAEVEPIHGG